MASPRASGGRASLTSAARCPRSFAAAPTFWDFFHEYFFIRISLARQSSRPDRVHKPWSRGLLAACVDICNWMGLPPAPTCTGFSRSSFRSRVTVCPVHGLPTSSMCVLRLLCVEFPVLWKSAKGFYPGTPKKFPIRGRDLMPLSAFLDLDWRLYDNLERSLDPSPHLNLFHMPAYTESPLLRGASMLLTKVEGIHPWSPQRYSGEARISSTAMSY